MGNEMGQFREWVEKQEKVIIQEDHMTLDLPPYSGIVFTGNNGFGLK